MMDARHALLAEIRAEAAAAHALLDGLLARCGGATVEQLQASVREKESFVQCPFDPSHTMPRDTFDEHFRACELRRQGIDTRQERQKGPKSSRFFYDQAPAVVTILRQPKARKIITAENALESMLTTTSNIGSSSDVGQARSRDDMHVVQMTKAKGVAEAIHSLVEPDRSNNLWYRSGESLLFLPSDTEGVKQRKIRMWERIPPEYASIAMGRLQPMAVRGWLFQNLPTDKSSAPLQLSSDIELSEHFYSSLCVMKRPDESVEIDAFLEIVRPYLGAGAARFVLSFWKYAIISLRSLGMDLFSGFSLDAQGHGRSDPTEVNARSNQLDGGQILDTRDGKPVENIVFMMDDDDPDLRAGQSLSADQQRSKYNRDVELANHLKFAFSVRQGEAAGEFQQAMERMRKLKDERDNVHRKNKAQLLAEQRDYKRRRQSYRAKNVHITQRTPTMIAREVIAAYMEDIELLQNIVSDKTESMAK